MKNSVLFCLIALSIILPAKAQSNNSVWDGNSPSSEGAVSHAPKANQTSEIIYGGSALTRTNYADAAIGKVYTIDLPYLTLDETNAYVLNFNLAHATTPGRSDALSILISSDTGQSWKTLYHNEGEAMSTASSTSEYYIPADADWKSNQVSLSGFQGEVLIRFSFVNGGGNNIYLNDINVASITGMSGF